MSDQPNMDIVDNTEAMARTMVELFASRVRQVLTEKACFRAAVSGGRTPRRFFELLSQTAPTLGIPWELCHVFWVDERFVPASSDASNYKLVKEALLDRIRIPQANVHPIPTDVDNVQAAARRYEHILREAFALQSDALPEFDLVILGMGRDGHTASLFPGTGQSLGLDGLARAVEARDYARITLTPAVIRAAANIVVLISGKDKAETLRAVFAGQAHEMDLPIRILWPVLEKVRWLVDRDAASRL